MSSTGTPPPSSEITPERLYLRRREFIRNAASFAATTATVGGGLLWLMGGGGRAESKDGDGTAPAPETSPGAASASGELAIARRENAAGDEPPTPYADVTTYNNFYEFGVDKGDPAENAHSAATRALDGRDRGRGREAAGRRHRPPARLVPARGARVPHALRRGVVDGDPVGRLPARRAA